MNKKLGIGIAGLGTVGEGFLRQLKKYKTNKKSISKTTTNKSTSKKSSSTGSVKKRVRLATELSPRVKPPKKSSN